MIWSGFGVVLLACAALFVVFLLISRTASKLLWSGRFLGGYFASGIALAVPVCIVGALIVGTWPAFVFWLLATSALAPFAGYEIGQRMAIGDKSDEIGEKLNQVMRRGHRH